MRPQLTSELRSIESLLSTIWLCGRHSGIREDGVKIFETLNGTHSPSAFCPMVSKARHHRADPLHVLGQECVKGQC